MKAAIGAGLLLILMGVSCQRGRMYTDTLPVNPEGWSATDLLQFTIPVEDTTAVFDLYLHLRHDGRYRYSNLFLFITTQAPTGESLRDTIECRLADPAGNWLGKGIGSQYQHTFPFKHQVIFPYSGTYRVEIQHGMRLDPLPWIRDVGLSVKKPSK